MCILFNFTSYDFALIFCHDRGVLLLIIHLLSNFDLLIIVRTRTMGEVISEGACVHYGHMVAKSLIFAAQIQIPIPNKCFRLRYKGLVFGRNNGWLMKNMDKGLTVPKWVLINLPKIYQPKLSAQAKMFFPFDQFTASILLSTQLKSRIDD